MAAKDQSRIEASDPPSTETIAPVKDEVRIAPQSVDRDAKSNPDLKANETKQGTAPEAKVKKWDSAQLCKAIAAAAKTHGIPQTFLARLIWTESRFDINALSPVGAQGVAQFMPGTAKERGLDNPYDPAQAIPASAALLKQHAMNFGNLGLAAAAYNAGAGRVRRWLGGRSQLPFETENYVAAITGNRANYFKSVNAVLRVPKLHKSKPFLKACRDLPVMRTRFKGLVGSGRSPWGVQVAGNFSQSKAMASWLRVRPKLGLAVGASKPELYRAKALRGLKRKWTVRLGTNSRREAIALCKKIRRAGGFCLVKKNR